jgi:hypothetical protein
MSKAKRLLEELLSEDYIFEMSNVFPDETGLKFKIWIPGSMEFQGRKLGHNPRRIKVDIDQKNSAPFKIDDLKFAVPTDVKAKDLDDLKNFVIQNKPIILAHMHGYSSSRELDSALVKSGETLTNYSFLERVLFRALGITAKVNMAKVNGDTIIVNDTEINGVKKVLSQLELLTKFKIIGV